MKIKDTPNYKNKHLGIWISFVFIVVFMLFPFYWAVNASLKTERQLMMTPATFIPRNPVTNAISPTLKNYKVILKDDKLILGIMNSLIVATSTTLLSLITSSFAAFALAKLRFRGKQTSLYIILAMTMFPQVTVLSGLYAVMNNLGLGARISMILSYMIFSLPLSTWLLTSFFKELPDEVIKSAQVDGATPFQSFRMILLPLLTPALVTTGILSFIASWNEYLFALTFTSINSLSHTIPVTLSLFSGSVSKQEPFGEIMAATVIFTLPVVILVLVFQRRIVSGLTLGAVKG